MKIDDFAEMWRARFFFAFKQKLDIERWSKTASFQRIESGQYRYDTGLIIRCRARVQSPFRIDFAAVYSWGQRHNLTARFHRCGSPRWLKGRRRSPRFWIDGLPIEMRINSDRACDARNFPFTITRARSIPGPSPYHLRIQPTHL